MEFERVWFLDEVRDGFLVPSMMKKAWASSIRYYEKLKSVCEKHDIRLFASWGTLISAVRHGGYIPWDDDLDLMILREDLEKLKDVLKNEPDVGEFHLQDYHATMGDNMVRQWLEKSVYIYDPDEWEKRYGFPFGDGIDIFVLDHIPKDAGERLHQARVIGACNTLQLLAKDIYGDGAVRDRSKESAEFVSALKEVERLTGESLKFSGSEPIRVQILDVMDRHVASYATGHEDAGVADIINYLGAESRLLPEEYLSDVIYVPYETGVMPVPIAYDSILRRYYGDYMVPQIDVSYGHDYPFYERYSDVLKKEFGFELLQFHFDEEEYKTCLAKREEMVPVKETIGTVSELLKEAHAYIVSALRDASSQKTDEVLELLGQCQTLAISLGSKAEVRLKNPSEFVGGLERYCEGIFKLYEVLCSSGFQDKDLIETETCFSACEELLACAGSKLGEGLKEILFICDRACHWGAMQAIWERERLDPGNHVTVIAMPHKYKDATWIEPEGGWETDADGYPSEVKLTSFEEYSIADIHPDVIYYTFPYDAYSDVIAPHPDFYTKSMVKYTDEMVFVTPFRLREIHDGDMRSRYTLGRFISNPGAVYADKIIVQSENMKGVYVELLDKMTDVIDWEKRVTDIESAYPGCKWMDDHSDLSFAEGDMSENSFNRFGKKVLLVYFSGSMLYDNACAVKKINKVIDLIEEQKDDIMPVWVSDPYAEQILKLHRPELWNEYEMIVKRISESDVWRSDDGKDIDRLAWACDAFYGDAGVLMNKCRMYGKPVMWESPEIGIENNG